MRASTFLTAEHLVGDTLYHTSKAGVPGVKAFAADYATYALSQLYRFSLDGDAGALSRAMMAATTLNNRFIDAENGGYFTTADDAETLLIRPKDGWDNATPAASSVMIEVCLVLAELTADASWREQALRVMRAFALSVAEHPAGYGWLLRQYETLITGLQVCVIVGDDTPQRAALEQVARTAYGPQVFTVVVATPDETLEIFAQRTNTGTPTAYVCQHMVCQQPVTTPDALRALLAPH